MAKWDAQWSLTLAEGDAYTGGARETCRLAQALQRGGTGDLAKVKRNYHLQQVVKFESRVLTASNVWHRSAGCPARWFVMSTYTSCVSRALPILLAPRHCTVGRATHFFGLFSGSAW